HRPLDASSLGVDQFEGLRFTTGSILMASTHSLAPRLVVQPQMPLADLVMGNADYVQGLATGAAPRLAWQHQQLAVGQF
ncbi:hypothetical protein NL323_31770, partial [Klebsiella pneumoniae]|nr:hypothetical protein [Klebsiella pneumoniae]